MKITIGKLLNVLPSIQKVTAADLTMKCLYWVRKMAKKIDNELKDFNECRQNLIEKYRDRGITDKIKIAEENESKYVDEYNALMDIEVELNFTKAVITDSENIKLSVNDINALENFVIFIFAEDMEGEQKND